MVITRKANFNPVFEETYDIMQRVQQEARAPFPNTSTSIKADINCDENHSSTVPVPPNHVPFSPNQQIYVQKKDEVINV
jgi:hypothetical protein